MPVMTKTPGGEEIVILSRAEFDRLVARREDVDDVKAADRIMARVANSTEEILTDAEVSELLNAPSPLAFWRKKRGLTQAALAKAAGIAQGFLSEIEAGKKSGDVKTLRKIASALTITLDDLT
jgi:DNA-binding XRE family transcriptional regulator